MWYRILSIGLLVSGAALAVGGFFGFLFGMPKAMVRNHPVGQSANQSKKNETNADDEQQTSNNSSSSIEPNTNLEQISDWLTKILVGAGLTQLNKMPAKLGQLSDYIAKGMSDSASDRAFAISVIIFFGICGFMAVFLWTRLYMAKLLESEKFQELKETDRKQQEQIERAQQYLKKIAQSGAERAMEDPFLADRQTIGKETQVEIAAELVKYAAEADRSSTDFMILAFHEFQALNYRAATENAEKALRASPQKEMLWKIYNLLGLCYHWHIPSNWKPGDDLAWFENAKRSYLKACENRNSLSEELLSKGNLCYAYLDAEKYDDCVKLADSVIKTENIGGIQITSLCDLARIACAAAKVLQGDNEGATAVLNSTKNLAEFEYLFNSDDLPITAIKKFSTLPRLNPEVETFLKRMAAK